MAAYRGRASARFFSGRGRAPAGAYRTEYARRNRAERTLVEQGAVLDTASGAVKRNPWHEVLVNGNSSLSQLATTLRLCVNSRISAKAAGKHDEKPKPKRAGSMFGA